MSKSSEVLQKLKFKDNPAIDGNIFKFSFGSTIDLDTLSRRASQFTSSWKFIHYLDNDAAQYHKTSLSTEDRKNLEKFYNDYNQKV